LSPLQFCISVISLTEQLTKLNAGYEEHIKKAKVSHLDDLKLVHNAEKDLQKQMQVVRTFSDNIHMEFGLQKRAKSVLKKVKLIYSKFNTLLQQRNTGAQTRKNTKVPWD
jgi:hypothetical protein